MKEMVGGCCVCSDERGWPENPLVYCDGQNCTVAVHQACYGIVTVPTGPWYCRKCESQERSARVRCELCPSRDGALKRTDTQSWAHVVCALYIPEVRFGNVTTMEPIILQIPPERFSKVCYICQEVGKANKANIGACMQCNKSGCKQQFHVTCGQALGLLCEEAGNYLDNVKYCGYCQHHYSKLKKGGNVKTIPPYKPVTHEVGSSDPSSSPEKETETVPSTFQRKTGNDKLASTSTTTTSSSSSSSTSNSLKQQFSTQSSSNSGGGGGGGGSSGGGGGGGTSTTSNSNPNVSIGNFTNENSVSNATDAVAQSTAVTASIESKSQQQPSTKYKQHSKIVKSHTSKDNSKESRDKQHSKIIKSHTSKDNSSSSSSNAAGDFDPVNAHSNDATTSNIVSNTVNASAKDNLGQKFTTSNFTESVVVNSDSVFGSETKPSTQPSASTSNVPIVKKRKLDSGKMLSTSSPLEDANRDIIKDVSVTLVPLPLDKCESIESKKKFVPQQKSIESPSSILQSSHISGGPSNGIVSNHQTEYSSAQTSSTTPTTAAVSLVVSVPLSTATLPGVSLTPNTSSAFNLLAQHQQHQQQHQQQQQQHQQQHQQQLHLHQQPHQHHLQHDLSEKDSLHAHDKNSSIIRNSSPLPSASKISLISESKSKNLSSLQSTATSFAELSAANMNSSSSSAPTITTMESGGIKVTYDKQANSIKHTATHLQEDNVGRLTSTPDDNSNSFSDLKISYEAQPNNYETPTITPRPDIKDSPPSSPSSEADSLKRNHTSTSGGGGGVERGGSGSGGGGGGGGGGGSNDAKEMKMFQKATHMLGNQLNPASSVAQKMSDQLYMELEAHSVYTSSSMDSAATLVGPMFPGKQLNHARNSAQSQPQGPSLSSMLGGTGTPTANGNTPQSLEQLLERQWEQGSQFLMEQAQHFDIASLLTCLHQLRSENVRLEEHVNNLVARRDHLLAVNARLALPLNQLPQSSNPNQAQFNNLHLNGSSEPQSRRSHHLK